MGIFDSRPAEDFDFESVWSEWIRRFVGSRTVGRMLRLKWSGKRSPKTKRSTH